MQDILGNSWVVSGIVAVVQIAIASFLVDRYVKRIQLKSEQMKWQAARLELGASLIYFAYSICGPTVHYTKKVEGKIRPRRNIGVSFSHIDTKCKDFNAMLAIYANSIPVEWYAKIVSASFEFQAAANNARIAVRNWEKIEKYLGEDNDIEIQIDFNENDVRKISGTDSYPVPRNYPEREIICFIYDYYHSIANISESARRFLSIAEMVIEEMLIVELDKTEIFKKLNDISKERSVPFTASYFREKALVWIEELEDYKSAMLNSGISLKVCPEFD